MINDTARIANDLKVVISTLLPDVEMNRLEIRLEEVLCNYDIIRKSDKEIANDFQEKIDLYLSARAIEGLSPKTIEGYRIELNLLCGFISKAVVQITTADIRQYLASNKSWMMSTVDSKLSKLKTFFGWLVREEMLLRDPTSKINPPKKPKRLKQSLSIEQLEIVRESCKTLRERALMETMYSTGCRLSEIANMKQTDINIQDMSIRVVGKGDKERICYLSFKCLHHLKRYLKSRTDECEYLFITERRPFRQMTGRTIQRVIDKIEERAELPIKLTPHVFRRSFAQLALNQGTELAEIQFLLGHENPATTLIYSQISEERKKQAHKRYHVQ